MAVFRHFKQQHRVDLSVTIGSHLILGKKNYLTKRNREGTWLLNQTLGKETHTQ